MSQQFNVVKCFQCAMFQVDIDKKSTNKWTCKLCGSKQSLKQVNILKIDRENKRLSRLS